MEDKSELITVKQMYEFLTEEIKNGNSDKFIMVNEYFIGSLKPEIGGTNLYMDAIHVQDVMEYMDETGDYIDC